MFFYTKYCFIIKKFLPLFSLSNLSYKINLYRGQINVKIKSYSPKVKNVIVILTYIQVKNVIVIKVIVLNYSYKIDLYSGQNVIVIKSHSLESKL